MNKSGKYLVWTVLSVMGSVCSGIHCFKSWEQINALWIVVAFGLYLSDRLPFLWAVYRQNVLAVDPTRMTPAVRHNDGLDYVPTDKKVLFGHHFAAIAGAGPLVSRYWRRNGLPARMIWLLAGVASPVRCRISWCCLFHAP
ncbi:MAG: carbon starvation CstA family protein [Escherichia sp.]